MKQRCRDLLTDETGAGLVEYVLVASLVSLAAYAGLTLFGKDVSKFFTSVAGDF